VGGHDELLPAGTCCPPDGPGVRSLGPKEFIDVLDAPD